VQPLAGAAAGTYYRVGRALSVADADGDEVLIAHAAAEEVVVS